MVGMPYHLLDEVIEILALSYRDESGKAFQRGQLNIDGLEACQVSTAFIDGYILRQAGMTDRLSKKPCGSWLHHFAGLLHQLRRVFDHLR